MTRWQLSFARPGPRSSPRDPWRPGANSQYVAAGTAGAQPLIAGRAAPGPRETFLLVRNGNGTASSLARANGSTRVRADAGAAPLVANRTAIGPLARFDPITN
jgi:hypothetical protein